MDVRLQPCEQGGMRSERGGMSAKSASVHPSSTSEDPGIAKAVATRMPLSLCVDSRPVRTAIRGLAEDISGMAFPPEQEPPVADKRVQACGPRPIRPHATCPRQRNRRRTVLCNHHPPPLPGCGGDLEPRRPFRRGRPGPTSPWRAPGVVTPQRLRPLYTQAPCVSREVISWDDHIRALLQVNGTQSARAIERPRRLGLRSIRRLQGLQEEVHAEEPEAAQTKRELSRRQPREPQAEPIAGNAEPRAAEEIVTEGVCIMATRGGAVREQGAGVLLRGDALRSCLPEMRWRPGDVRGGRCRCRILRAASSIRPLPSSDARPAAASPSCMVRRYQCGQCGAEIRSRFLFDGLVFDAEYFRQKMAESPAAQGGTAGTGPADAGREPVGARRCAGRPI